MGLPKWVLETLGMARPGRYNGSEDERYMGCCNLCDDSEKLREALSIAWEALEEHKNDVYSIADYFGHKRSFCKCKKAMSRIAALGDTSATSIEKLGEAA